MFMDIPCFLNISAIIQKQLVVTGLTLVSLVPLRLISTVIQLISQLCGSCVTVKSVIF